MIHESLVCQEDPKCVLHTPKLGVGCAHSAEIAFLWKEIQLPLIHIGKERQELRLKSNNFFPLDEDICSNLNVSERSRDFCSTE